VVDPIVYEHIGNLELEVSEAEYLSNIGTIHRYIAQGDTYQVNYTIRAKFSYDYDPIELYLALRATQAVSYSAFIRVEDHHILSLSPELFFRIDGDTITSRPMKGTAPRGKTLEEDMMIARELFGDIKNRAENVMIVDLIRNDIGRLTETGSVVVPELFTIERYKTLFQMTSTVQGRLKGRDWREIFQSLFPCGSVTGAPKIRTMEIIAELESSPRGVYTGAIGFITPAGDAVFNVAIRTVELERGKGIVGIGSGITIGSNPKKEYEECALKSHFIVKKYEDFSLIETLLFDPSGEGGEYDSGFYLLPYHLTRLRDSAHYFGFDYDQERFLEYLMGLIPSLKESDSPARVRCTVERSGAVNMTWSPISPMEEPVKIGLSNTTVDPEDPFLYHKTTKRTLFDRLHKEACQKGLFDYLVVNRQGEVTEGAITNLFLESKGTLITPPISCGLLNGTLRRHLIETGRAEEAPVRPHQLLEADAIYVGNSVRGLLKAVLVEDLHIPSP